MKRKLCQTLAMSILLYNCETWVLNETMIQKLKKAYDWCIKIAMNIPFNVREAETGKQTSSGRREEDDGQKQTNNEDKNVKAEQYKRESYDEFAIRYGFQPVLELIRQRRLIWLGHILRNKNNDTTTYETVLASIKCRCRWWIETEEMLKILNTTWEEFEKVASKVENKFIVRKEIKRANVALRNTDNNSNAKPVAKTKPRNKNYKMMMQQNAPLFAPD